MGHGFRNKNDGTRNSQFGCPVTKRGRGASVGKACVSCDVLVKKAYDAVLILRKTNYLKSASDRAA